MAGATHRSWIYTLNNYSEEECESALTWNEHANCHYCAKEVAATGTPHLQGYITLKTPRRISWLRNNLSQRAHFEPAIGDRDSNYKYIFVEKPEGHGPIGTKFIEHFVSRQGERSDIVAAAECIHRHGVKRTAEDHPEAFVKYHSGLCHLQSARMAPRDPANPPTVLWCTGPSGSGKTRWVYDHFAVDDVYRVKMRSHPGATFWWTGYTQQYVALLDDVRPDVCTFLDLLAILDRYPLGVATASGETTQLRSPIIIVTSVLGPTDYNNEEQVAQLYRRIGTVLSFQPGDTPPTPYSISADGVYFEIDDWEAPSMIHDVSD